MAQCSAPPLLTPSNIRTWSVVADSNEVATYTSCLMLTEIDTKPYERKGTSATGRQPPASPYL